MIITVHEKKIFLPIFLRDPKSQWSFRTLAGGSTEDVVGILGPDPCM